MTSSWYPFLCLPHAGLFPRTCGVNAVIGLSLDQAAARPAPARSLQGTGRCPSAQNLAINPVLIQSFGPRQQTAAYAAVTAMRVG